MFCCIDLKDVIFRSIGVCPSHRLDIVKNHNLCKFLNKNNLKSLQRYSFVSIVLSFYLYRNRFIVLSKHCAVNILKKEENSIDFIHFIWSFIIYLNCCCVSIYVILLYFTIDFVIFVERNQKQRRCRKMLYGQNHTRHMRNSNAHHSMRLQNFLFNHQNYQLSDIVNHVCEFAQDRDGSKFIQRKLDEAPDHRKSTIFNELYTNLHALIKHRFANFVVQKFFTIGNHEQYVKLYKHIKDHFLELSLDKYGCRVVQKAIETSTPINLFCMMDKFTEENIMILAMDPNGNHVIQNVFRTAGAVPNRHIQVIYSLRENVFVNRHDTIISSNNSS